MILLVIYLVITSVLSVVAFCIYGHDKKLAIAGKPRVKEKILLGIAALGGALGAFFGRLKFRHKTDKKYFSIVIYCSLILELVVLVAMILEVLK